MKHITHNYIRLIILQSIIIGMLLFPTELMADDFYVEHMTSPQVSDMFRYGNVETSLFTGKLNFAIPIYSLEDPDFDLDIALRYNSEGFKPTKQSGYVGYGWFLEAGGCITREVKGYADEMKRQDAFSSVNYIGMLSFIRENEINTDKLFALDSSVFGSDDYKLGNSYFDDVDYLPDVFRFNVCGFQGAFIINNDGEAIILNGDFVKIDLSMLRDCESNTGTSLPVPNTSSSITLITKDGYCYIFGGNLSAIEYTISTVKDNNIPEQQVPIINTWHLTKIIAPNGRSINFYYKPRANILDNPNEFINYTDPLWSFSEYCDRFAPDPKPLEEDRRIRYSMTKECILDSIIINGKQTVEVEFSNKVDEHRLYDYNMCNHNYMLEGIKVSSCDNILRLVRLNHIYQHSTDAQGDPANYWRFLSSVYIGDIGTYSFSYYNPCIYPFIHTSATWYKNNISTFGYYNTNSYTLGLLKDVVYPTGAKQQFTYGLHQCAVERCYSACQGNNISITEKTDFNLPNGRGVRIEQIKSYLDNTLIETKSYSYNKKNSTTSSGIYYNTSVTYRVGPVIYGETIDNAFSYSFFDSHVGYSTIKEATIYPANNETHEVIYSFDTGINSYSSTDDKTINRIDTNATSSDSVAAILSGMLVYDSHLSPNSQLLSLEYYKNGSPTRTKQFIYNGISHSTGSIQHNQYPSLGNTDTIVVFAFHHIPISRKLFVSPPVLKEEITKDFLIDNQYLYNSRYVLHDSKFRTKQEWTTNSDGMTYFTKYTYPDEFNFSNMSTVGLYPSPYALLKKRNQISEPIETISGYMDGDQEKVTSGRINLFNTNRLIVPNDSRRVPGGSVVVDSNLIIIPDSMILQTQPYPVLYKNLDLHIANSINDYQPISVVNDSLRYDSRYRLTCTYEFDSMLRLTSITPVNNVTTSYTWDGIYPVSKTVGNQTSTFSYIPYVGMSSMTDARGVTTYYAYDTYGRLIEVYRQHNTHGKEILNHYIYHTKTE